MLVDSHCHLDYIISRNESDSIPAILARANENGVQHMLSVCIDLKQFLTLKNIVEQYDNITISVGVHPSDVEKDNIVSSADLIRYADHDKVVAIGETGLDYFYPNFDKNAQQLSFRKHIEASITTKKPLIIHARDAFSDIYSILRDYKSLGITGVMHCFTGSLQEAEEALELGFYISFSGIITFKNSKELQEVAKKVPLDKILIETDSPYLAPVPFRGKINEPAYVKFVAEKLADLRDVSVSEIAERTTKNFYELFKCY